MDDVYRMPLGPLSSAVWIVLAVMFAWVSLLLWSLEVVSARLRERNSAGLSLGADGCRTLSKLRTVTFVVGAAMLSERKSSSFSNSLEQKHLKGKISSLMKHVLVARDFPNLTVQYFPSIVWNGALVWHSPYGHVLDLCRAVRVC